MGMFDNLRQQAEQRKTDDEKAYWTFLSTLDIAKPSAADTQRLNVLLQATGRTVEKAESDAELVAEVLRLRRIVKSNPDYLKRVDETYEKKMAVYAERQKLNQEMTAKVNAAVGANQQAEADRDHIINSLNALKKLEESNPVAHRAAMAAKL